MLYTGSWKNPALHKGQRISISLKTPTNLKIDGRLDFFMPAPAMLKTWMGSAKDDAAWKQYLADWWPLMEQRRPQIMKWFEMLDAQPQTDQTLCCYEPTPSRCHRSLVGKIIQKYRPDLWGGEVKTAQESSIVQPAKVLTAQPQSKQSKASKTPTANLVALFSFAEESEQFGSGWDVGAEAEESDCDRSQNDSGKSNQPTQTRSRLLWLASHSRSKPSLKSYEAWVGSDTPWSDYGRFAGNPLAFERWWLDDARLELRCKAAKLKFKQLWCDCGVIHDPKQAINHFDELVCPAQVLLKHVNGFAHPLLKHQWKLPQSTAQTLQLHSTAIAQQI